ncbi:non-ribosomal peptide synthetase [Streptomyces alkaliterrae]|uniref:Phenyloxazoline synthase MbtB n=1 Tax=Streptomyces alkaliterrae TaxID=2213162 RepID=A0A5P0YU39_9ACTN|nr:non-ribosomal peptide synthetase [Streptomyces alkaliterrae]MBB1257455.1 amino acid adenylation domain-containing protein [Streptomyces alkaliterrae]MQS02962.1 amino acid adenylation domain-containing protein [Streptomyces alkaliterrae]
MTAADIISELEQAGLHLWEDEGRLRFRGPEGVMTPERRELLAGCREDVLRALRERGPRQVRPDPASAHEPFPLTEVQSAYLLGRRGAFEYGSVPCHAYGELEFPALDRDRLLTAWQQVVDRHDMLRVVIDYDGYQRVLEDPPAPVIGWHDATGLPEAAGEEALREVRGRLSAESKDVTVCPLYSLEVTELADRAVLHFSIDFLIADYVSIYRLLDEFGTFYEDPDAALPAPAISFRDYLRAERAVRQGPAYERDRDYWTARLDSLPPAPELPLVDRPSRQGPAGFTRRELRLDPVRWSALKARAGEQRVSASTAVMAAYAEVIGRWSRNPRFTLDVTVLSRLPLHPDVGDIVGDFTSVELLAVDGGCAGTFAERARRAGEQLFQDLDHRLFSGVEVLRELTRRRGQQGSMMPVVFTSAIGLSDGLAPQGLMRSEIRNGISQTPQVWVDCQAMEAGGSLLVNWDVRDGTVPGPVLDDMFAAYRDLLHRLADEDDAWDGDPLALPEHQARQRAAANNTARPLSDALLHRALLDESRRRPDATAVVDHRGSVDYATLTGRAAAVAAALAAQGHKPHQRVAVVLDKGWEQIAGALGVLLAGGTYVPVEAGQPDARRNKIIESAGIGLVVAHSTVGGELPADLGRIDVDRLPTLPAEAAEAAPVAPDDSAYVIFTSGSTGEPKGVEISHRAAVNTLDDVCRRFGVGAHDVALGLSSLGFDLSVFDVFGVLGRGGTLVLPDPERRGDPSHWAELISAHGVTVLNTVPAQMMLLEEYLRGDVRELGSVRLGMMSGDWIPVTLPDAVRARLPRVELYSLGGATEASIWSIVHPIGEVDPTAPSIPYGTPLENQRFHVLDAFLRPCPDLVVGDLYIAGAGLATGYLGDPEKTAAAFFELPDGERVYRTGDLARYLPDGTLEFIGRDDRQVKIRGHRVELAEVESALAADPQVDAVAATTQGERNDRRLVAFVSPAPADPADHAVDPTLRPEVLAAADEVRDGVDVAKVVEFAAVLDDAALRRMVDVLRREGVWPDTATRHSTSEIMRLAGVAPKHERLVRRWLAACVENGYLDRAEDGTFGCPRLVSPEDVEQAWAEVDRLLPEANDRPELVDYFKLAAAHLPELMRDERDPLRMLFPEGDLSIHEAAYMEGFLSRYLNRLATSTVLGVARRNASGRPLRVLEVGAGVGGTSVDTIPALDGENVRYTFSDVSQFFLNKAGERFADRPWVDYALFDFNEPFREQGVRPNSVDVILCGNVMHYAKDARAVLRRMREALVPGGWLVFIETTRDNYQILTSMEFLFDATAGDFQDVRHGRDQTFIGRRQWCDLLSEAGAELELCVPAPEDELARIGMHVFAARFKTDREPVDAEDLTRRLAERLPAEMIPSRVEVLDALPLTDNGKVDRATLAEWAEQHRTTGTTAAGEGPRAAGGLESSVAEVYAEVLRESEVALETNFYALGGDSLLAAQLVTALRERVPAAGEVFFDELLRELLGGASVRELSAFLQQGQDAPEQSGAGDELVLAGAADALGNPVHVLVGDGLGGDAQRLAADLGALDPVIVVPPVRVGEGQDLDDVAQEIVAKVRALSPGPFHLVGAHIGGVLALAVAQQLVELAAPVCGLTVLSSYPLPATVRDDVLEEALLCLDRGQDPAALGYPDATALGAALAELAPAGDIPPGALAALADGGPELRAVGETAAALGARSRQERLAGLAGALGVGADELAGRLAGGRALAACVAAHDLGVYTGETRLLVHEEESPVWPDMAADMTALWESVCVGGIRRRTVPGDHFTCRELVTSDVIGLPEEENA